MGLHCIRSELVQYRTALPLLLEGAANGLSSDFRALLEEACSKILALNQACVAIGRLTMQIIQVFLENMSRRLLIAKNTDN